MFPYRIQTIVLAGLISMSAAWAAPVPSQRPEDKTAEKPATDLTTPAKADTSSPAAKAITTEQPTIPVDELELLVQPLTLAELETEAAAWLALVKVKVQEISNAEIGIKRKNRQLEQEAGGN